MYEEEDFLMISGLQHFVFCRRQWALIHIEQQWAENGRTTDGHLFHKTAHKADFVEKRGDLIITRGLAVRSNRLGITGVCDVVEFHRAEEGITLSSHLGLWKPYPVEYKRGEPKENDADEVQLCAQALCLEEMLLCNIPQGSLFYGENRRRVVVDFTPSLRARVEEMCKEMHVLWARGYTPKGKPQKGCRACSLQDLCLPKLGRMQKVEDYIADNLAGD